MRTTILSLLLAMLATTVAAQKVSGELSIEQSTIKAMDGRDISVKRYVSKYFDLVAANTAGDSDLIFLVLKERISMSNRHRVVCLDLAKDAVLYSHEIKGNSTSLRGGRDYIIRYHNNRTIVYSARTGKKLWSAPVPMAYVDYKRHVAVSYEGIGYNLFNGKPRWGMKMDSRYGWNSTNAINDSTLLIATDGLQCVNVVNGDGWYYKIATGQENYARAAVVSAIGMATAVFTGVCMFIIDADVLHNACSNILAYDKGFVFAGKDDMMCIDRDGNERWGVDLPVKTGASTIIMRGDTIQMVGSGRANMNNRSIRYGDAVVAAFNVRNGAPIYTNVMDKQNVISYEYANKELLLRTNKFFSVLDLFSGKTLRSLNIGDTSAYKDYTVVVDRSRFLVQVGDDFRPLAEAYPGHYFLHNAAGNFLRLDASLRPVEVIPDSKIKARFNVSDKISLISGNDYTHTCVEKNGKPVLNISAMPDKVSETRLVSYEKNALQVVDISSL